MKRPDIYPTTFDGLLSKIIEEACEVLRVISKIQIHGQIAIDHGVNPPREYNNLADLQGELRDLEIAIERTRHKWPSVARIQDNNASPYGLRLHTDTLAQLNDRIAAYQDEKVTMQNRIKELENQLEMFKFFKETDWT